VRHPRHTRIVRIWIFLGITVVISLPTLALAQAKRQAAASKPEGEDGSVQRGKYIVEGVARCGQCHTPRDGNGNPETTHALQGAPVWLKSAESSENWPLVAPRIAGTLPGSDAEMVRLLTTGIWQDGQYLRPPMPKFRMSQEDAKAVVAYLKSIP
jgi:mono/diheme cytochrome c family protein